MDEKVAEFGCKPISIRALVHMKAKRVATRAKRIRSEQNVP